MTREEIDHLLTFIGGGDGRERWRNTGMGIHAAGGTQAQFDAWARQWKDMFDQGAQDEAWRSFKDVAGGIGPGSLVYMAEQGGYVRPQPHTNGNGNNGTGRKQLTGITLAQLAEAKKLLLEFLTSHGLRDATGKFGGPVVEIPYFLSDGKPAPRWRIRIALTAPRGKKRFIYNAGEGKIAPYINNLVPGTGGDLGFVEGESDALTGWYHELAIIGIPGSSMSRTLQPHHLDTHKPSRIILYIEPGDGGVTFLAGMTKRLRVCGWLGPILIVRWPEAIKDLSGLHLKYADEPGGFERELAALIEQAEVDTSASADAEYLTKPYRATPGGFIFEKHTAAGNIIEIPISNFTAQIKKELLHDDGAETVRYFQIEANLREGAVKTATIPAGEFSSLAWVSESLGAAAIISAGKGAHDQTREAILRFSTDVQEECVFEHTGWRKIDGIWRYLHRGGAISADGSVAAVRVELPTELRHFELPAPLFEQERRDAVRACMHILDLAPDRVTAPLFCAPWRAVLDEAAPSLFAYGKTGVFKTELTAIVMQHFGPGFNSKSLPGEWSSTGNALEAVAHILKNSVFVVDDYKPSAMRAERERLEQKADFLLRGAGNQSGRKRLNRDAVLKVGKHPRCLAVSSGEELPPGASLNARLFGFEVRAGDVDPTKLTALQHEAAQGVYAGAMARFLAWLSPQIDGLHAKLKERVLDLRAKAARANQHARIPSLLADLFLGTEFFTEFALSIGAISADEEKTIKERVWKGLLAGADEQIAHQKERDPGATYCRLIVSAIASGIAYVADMKGGPPPNPVGWGWREHWVGTGENERSEWRPRGSEIGWLDNEEKGVFFDRNASFLIAQRMGGLDISPETLPRRLRDGGFLSSVGTSVGRNCVVVQRTIKGVRNNHLIHLKRSALEGDEEAQK